MSAQGDAGRPPPGPDYRSARRLVLIGVLVAVASLLVLLVGGMVSSDYSGGNASPIPDATLQQVLPRTERPADDTDSAPERHRQRPRRPAGPTAHPAARTPPRSANLPSPSPGETADEYRWRAEAAAPPPTGAGCGRRTCSMPRTQRPIPPCGPSSTAWPRSWTTRPWRTSFGSGHAPRAVSSTSADIPVASSGTGAGGLATVVGAGRRAGRAAHGRRGAAHRLGGLAEGGGGGLTGGPTARWGTPNRAARAGAGRGGRAPDRPGPGPRPDRRRATRGRCRPAARPAGGAVRWPAPARPGSPGPAFRSGAGARHPPRGRTRSRHGSHRNSSQPTGSTTRTTASTVARVATASCADCPAPDTDPLASEQRGRTAPRARRRPPALRSAASAAESMLPATEPSEVLDGTAWLGQDEDGGVRLRARSAPRPRARRACRRRQPPGAAG